MIASIVLTGKHNIGINGNNKIKVEDHLLSLKDIPFIRYRFEKYGDEEIEFIKKNMEKFKGPVHLAEITLSEDTGTVLDRLEDEIGDIARFVYIPIDDEDIANGLKDTTYEMLRNFGDAYYDRLIIKDKSTMLYPVVAHRLKIKIEEAVDGEVKASDIGICGSPLSFRTDDTPGQACLTAVWARKIMAEYAEDDDIVVPSASHECMNCCGCIRYFVVSSDLPAPLSSKEKSESKKASGESSEPKEKKPAKPKGAVTWCGL